MWCCEGGKVDRLNPIEVALGVEETDGVTSNEAAERVANDTELGYRRAIPFKLLKKCLDLLRDPLSASLDAIVCVAS